jgi:hypothetical protein
MSMANACITASPSVGNTKSPRSIRRRRAEARWESTRLDQDRETIEPGDLVIQRINPSQRWEVIGREGESGLWSCRNDRGVTQEYFAHELQRVDQRVTMQAIWERETLRKRGSSLTGAVLQVSRAYSYVVVLLSTGKPVMLYPEDLPDWFRAGQAAASQPRRAA